MTEKQMNKFADLIANKVIDKIKTFQEELDNEFIEKIEELNNIYDTTINPLNQNIIDEQHNVLLEQLENNLKLAIEAENYELANELQQKIKDLKNK
jgi:predicted transcriptional regulator